jgi:hypothetical protein
VYGDAPNVAARVQALAEPGTVLITARVQRQTAGLFVAEDRGAHALKGAPDPTTLFRIVRASGGRRFGARALTPLVGREEELDLLRRRWERAARGEGQFVQIVGEPGIGKSRLVGEFRLRLGETPHTFVEWSSSQLLQNTPLHPLAEWGRQRFGGTETPAPQRLADLENTLRLIGLDPAEYGPLLAPLVEIPLHDPTSLDLMQALAERGTQAPLLILATTRPEFRPPWSLRSHHSVISLDPLDRADVAQMVGELAQRHALSKDVIDGVSERTGGVPLFIEEVTRLLLERGEAGGARAIPPTLQQSLAARLERLGPAREVAQIGAVLGRDFTHSLLRAVGGLDDSALQSALDRLADADLIIAEGAGPQANYRFKHALIQDAAYDSLLKSRRQALHRRAAEILVGQPERAAAEPELIAHHFTEASLDDLAIEWWGKAGDQALRRSAFQEAIAHLGQAIAMADRASATARRAPGGSAAPSKRSAQIQVAYGNALLAARGQGARFRQSPRVGVRRQGCAGAVGGRLRLMGRQLRARRVAIDAGARSGLPRRRRRETRFVRGRRRPSRRRDDLLVRRRVSRGAGSFRTRARLVPTRPRRRSGLSLRSRPRRCRDGLYDDCAMASRRSRSRGFAYRPRADADRGPHPCRHARGWKTARSSVRIDARRPRACCAERPRTRPPRARP